VSSASLYAASLGLTVAIETPLAALLCSRGGRGPGAGEVQCAALLANLVSHPAAAALISLAGCPWLAAEAGVVAFEALALQGVLGVDPKRAWLASGLCNGLTAALALAAAPG
jgi:hypothetical protein